jgi:glutamate 5-kinase
MKSKLWPVVWLPFRYRGRLGLGKDFSIIQKIFAGDEVGTFFYPQTKVLKNRSVGLPWNDDRGRVIIDEGAYFALMRNKSLLPAGIKGVEGVFDSGDCMKLSMKKVNRLPRVW